MEQTLIALTGFVLSLFVLYRLLVKNYEKQIHILKDEIEYKQNYKYKLEEFKTFHEEDLKVLSKRLTEKEELREHLESQMREAKKQISEINTLLAQESTKRSKVEELMEHVHKRYRQQIEESMSEIMRLQQSLDAALDQYRVLVAYVKDKHGPNALLEFHYSDDTAT